MGLAKLLRTNPREIASKIVDALLASKASNCFSDVSIAGPGFINLTLADRFLAERVAQSPQYETVGPIQRIVVDYSSPNIAKELHVGHLRSTVIGDAIARILEFTGHDVVRQNHVGDWGTTFGKLLAYLEDGACDDPSTRYDLTDLEQIYVAASNRFDTDPEFASRSRDMVLHLQEGDKEATSKWKDFIGTSQAHMQKIYQQLDVSLKPEHIRGESAYNNDLPLVIELLQKSGLLTESEGAKCVFLDEFVGKDKRPLPMIVQKSDGGYLYHTTDLATLRYRQSELHADRVMYFTDARQNLHFEMLFAVARAATFVSPETSLEHHSFGKLLNKSGQPFSTRTGSSLPLQELIEEAHNRATDVVNQKSASLAAAERALITHAVAVGAIKYADLSKNRSNDYKFDWDTMLSLEGNTAPYLQYAYARIQSLFAKGQIKDLETYIEPKIVDPTEHQLALQLLQFQETLELVNREVKPHYLCSYLYELTVKFMRFYETCPILSATEELKSSRLTFCKRTARTLRLGLNCLGIQVLDRM